MDCKTCGIPEGLGAPFVDGHCEDCERKASGKPPRERSKAVAAPQSEIEPARPVSVVKATPTTPTRAPQRAVEPVAAIADTRVSSLPATICFALSFLVAGMGVLLCVATVVIGFDPDSNIGMRFKSDFAPSATANAAEFLAYSLPQAVAVRAGDLFIIAAVLSLAGCIERLRYAVQLARQERRRD